MTDAMLDEIEAGRAIARRDHAAPPRRPPIDQVRAACAALRAQQLGYIVAPCRCAFDAEETALAPCAEAVAAATETPHA
jgi:beta-phosphoglucomutase-like phosphatase (HAD superfamily)